MIEGGVQGVVGGDEGADVGGGEGGEDLGLIGSHVGEEGGIAEMRAL